MEEAQPMVEYCIVSNTSSCYWRDLRYTIILIASDALCCVVRCVIVLGLPFVLFCVLFVRHVRRPNIMTRQLTGTDFFSEKAVYAN